MKTERIAFIKSKESFSEKYTKWQQEIDILKEALIKKFGLVDEVCWNDAADISWTSYKAIYIASVGPPNLYPKFIKWCDKILDSRIKIYNQPKTLKFYINKVDYLKSLREKGIPIIQTVPIDKTNIAEIKQEIIQIAHNNGWDKLIVKPVFGTGGMDNHLIHVSKENISNLKLESSKTSYFVQNFMSNVNIEGEYSFLFYGNKFSHAVLKKPNESDHRTHEFNGGSTSLITPTQQDLDSAEKVMNAIVKITGEPAHKFRIDMIRCEKTNQLLLLELELGDPVQYFSVLDQTMRQRAIENFLTSTI
jgi:hypothetical protein